MPTVFGFISTYPPTQCGLATFTASLRTSLLRGPDDYAPVVRLLDEPASGALAAVVADAVAGDLLGSALAARRLADCDVVVLQHEFGVYGGADGEEVLGLLAELPMPTIVVLHTVLVSPSIHQRVVLEAVVAAADAVVTMSAAARDRLLAGYDVDPAKIEIIAHGAPDMGAPAARSTSGPTVLTWGLLGPGKGIEWGIRAMSRLRDVRPTYLVAGETHPKIVARDGERYRRTLAALAVAERVSDSVVLDGRYRDASALAELVAAADVVLLPYDSTDQVTSGVLIEAVAARKPVVATAFPHAVELLSGGAGAVVAHRDPDALAEALREVLTGPGVADTMSRAAAEMAPGLGWPAVGARYDQLAARLLARVPVSAA